MKKEEYRLKNFIKEFGGPTRVGAALGVTEHAVRVWMRGTSAPRAEFILKLVRLSKNKLTFESIVEDATRNADLRPRKKKSLNTERGESDE